MKNKQHEAGEVDKRGGQVCRFDQIEAINGQDMPFGAVCRD
jgi:hypothetical protein